MTTNSKAPTHIAYVTREGSNGKKYNDRIGVAWAHKTGGGLNVKLNTLPIDGDFVIFPRETKTEPEQGAEA